MAEKSLLGKKAPSFALKDKDGDVVSLKDLTDDFIVVYFYPKDNTPGCTIEAKKFSSDLKKFKKLKTTVLGISGGDEKSKTKFCRDQKLTVTLLSDPEFKVCKSFGVYGEKTFMGRKHMGIFRKTFLLNKDRKIIKVYDKVGVEEHSAELLQEIQSLLKTQPLRATPRKSTPASQKKSTTQRQIQAR